MWREFLAPDKAIRARNAGATGHHLALGPGAWQSGTMVDQSPAPRKPQQAGGCLIAAGLILGPIIGMAFGQTSIGLVAGGVIGVVAAIVMTVSNRA